MRPASTKLGILYKKYVFEKNIEFQNYEEGDADDRLVFNATQSKF